MLNRTIRFFLENRLLTFILLIVLIVAGISTSPFRWQFNPFPENSIAVDAIPDLGENQQIVYTEWPGQSPQDIEDQISYPLTTNLLGIPGVKSIRSNSIFGLSSIYIIFDDDVDYYWSRSRILEKLSSLPNGLLPEGASPAIGPDATALGQVYWYTLEGRDKNNNPVGGWDPQELRSIQDFHVKYALSTSEGVAEVASIGGHIKEYQIEVDPLKMKAQGVNIGQIMAAVKNSNLDIGARTLEYNRAEYLVRSIGYIKDLKDLEESVVSTKNYVPIRLKDVAKVQYGPANRRGGLDKDGAEAVGGVVVTRYGVNPMETIENIKEKIKEITPGLPSKTLEDGTISKVSIIPFYDRSGLIKETLGTLEEAISQEILISIIVVMILVLNLRASFLISSLLPIGVLIAFITMKQFGVDANIVALSGIAIAIGVMVDVGIVFTENIIRHCDMPENKGARGKDLVNIIYTSTTEVAGAVVTALATTIISFLPVFSLEAAEGKLFHPLAFTKTFTMLAALMIGLVIIPTLAYLTFSIKPRSNRTMLYGNIILILLGISLWIYTGFAQASIISLFGVNGILSKRLYPKWKAKSNIAICLLVVVYFLGKAWLPLGTEKSLFENTLFVAVVILLILGGISLVILSYEKILKWCLSNKWKFLSIPIILIIFSLTIWIGFGKLFSFMPAGVKDSYAYQYIEDKVPGLGKEFMPTLNEGSFLLMPTSMPHAGIEENLEVVATLDRNVNAIPEVESVVGKWGRVNSAMDPAPTSMYENIINYKPEYMLNEEGQRIRFKTDNQGYFILKNGDKYKPSIDEYRHVSKEELIEDNSGNYFRQWRTHIQSPDDIWNEIIHASNIPGVTSAPKLQPIQTRLVMLQTGMRAPMGIKVFGPDLKSIEEMAQTLEEHLKEVEGVQPTSVFADRVVGKPYLEIVPKRDELSRYGIQMKDLQNYISSSIGGMELSKSVEGRERYPIRVRFARAYREDPSSIEKLLIPTADKSQVPLGMLASINYTQGPQMIRSENSFLMAYVIFDKLDNYAEVNVVENAQEHLQALIDNNEINVPDGVSYQFTGNYENQQRASKRLMLLVPLSLIVIFLILYFQFKSAMSAALIFTSVLVTLSGGFIMLWLYGQEWFLDINLFGMHFRDLFQIHTINLSVAVWVGFIALFGIATDDGVLISTYIKQLQDKRKVSSINELRALILEAGKKRVRPAMMTTATTIIALLPVLTSTGKGAEIMIPMAIPLFGGMTIEILSIFIVPVLYAMWQESKIKKLQAKERRTR